MLSNFGLPTRKNIAHHDAKEDAELCGNLYMQLMKEIKQKGIKLGFDYHYDNWACKTINREDMIKTENQVNLN